MRRSGIHGTFQSRVFHDKLATVASSRRQRTPVLRVKWNRFSGSRSPARNHRHAWFYPQKRQRRPHSQKQRWKISSRVSSSRIEDISCLPNRWSAPKFRCLCRIFRNETRRLAWNESSATGKNLKDERRAAVLSRGASQNLCISEHSMMNTPLQRCSATARFLTALAVSSSK